MALVYGAPFILYKFQIIEFEGNKGIDGMCRLFVFSKHCIQRLDCLQKAKVFVHWMYWEVVQQGNQVPDLSWLV